jgi:hypothetical protein
VLTEGLGMDILTVRSLPIPLLVEALAVRDVLVQLRARK